MKFETKYDIGDVVESREADATSPRILLGRIETIEVNREGRIRYWMHQYQRGYADESDIICKYKKDDEKQ